MTDVEASQDGEIHQKYSPVFYKKKVFSVEKITDLDGKMKGWLKDNERLAENEKAMLDNIRDKDDKFVKSLESYLEEFQRVGAEEIDLVEDMFPQWSPPRKETESEPTRTTSKFDEDDPMEKLNEWYDTMNTYVNTQRNNVEEIISDWYKYLDEIGNEGEADPKVLEYATNRQKDPLVSSIGSINIAYYFLILICVVNLFIFYQTEDLKECVEEPGKCIMNGMVSYFTLVTESYLAFHNMTFEQIVHTSALNSSLK